MLYYLCELAKGQDAAKAYLPDTSAVVGRRVSLDVNGKKIKGFEVTAILQTIEPQFVEDNHMAYKAMPCGGASRRTA